MPASELLTDPEIRPLGVNGVLVRFSRVLSEASNQRTVAFQALLKDRRLPGIVDIASSLASVRVEFDPTVTNRAVVAEGLLQLNADMPEKDAGPARIWHIPAAFGPSYAPQLAEAASLVGLTPDDAVSSITSQTVRVMAIGFAPGQPYLGLLSSEWDIPRQSQLTESLPNGALVTAVRQLIIFSADAPTGWRHIGQTAFQVYRPDATDPFPFQSGDAVRFSAVSDEAFTAIQADTATNGGARCEVLR